MVGDGWEYLLGVVQEEEIVKSPATLQEAQRLGVVQAWANAHTAEVHSKAL